jgi:hypothetical protein
MSVAGCCRMARRSRDKSKSRVTTVLTLARAGYGVALVCAPQVLIKLTGDPVTGQPAGASRVRPSRRACAVARVLGVRHLVQAGLTAATLRAGPGSPVPLGLGAGVDVLHASTMVGLALVDRGARRVALADAGLELALAAAGVLTATQYLPPNAEHRRRDVPGNERRRSPRGAGDRGKPGSASRPGLALRRTRGSEGFCFWKAFYFLKASLTFSPACLRLPLA